MSDLGSETIPRVIEDIAVGTRATARRARRREPLAGIAGVTAKMRTAASMFRQAHEHVEAGRGMGPMPWAADRVAGGGGARMLAQERALTAAEWRRRGADAMGVRAVDVVVHVVVEEWTLAQYEAHMRWRHGGARAVLLSGLSVLARQYGV